MASKRVLKLQWDYALYQPPEKVETGTTAKALRKALSNEQAFRAVAGTDPRPLLVLRECEVCNGTDDALFSKGADNERTMLLATWFHCVKLPMDVLQKDHPFYELFGHDDPEHFFVALPDGSMKLTLENQTSRTELWDALGTVLSASYEDDPNVALKVLQKSLDRLDRVDTKLLELRAKKNQLLETEAQGSRKLIEVETEIAEAGMELEKVQAEIAKASKLTPKAAAPAVPSAGKAKPGG